MNRSNSHVEMKENSKIFHWNNSHASKKQRGETGAYEALAESWKTEQLKNNNRQKTKTWVCLERKKEEVTREKEQT